MREPEKKYAAFDTIYNLIIIKKKTSVRLLCITNRDDMFTVLRISRYRLYLYGHPFLV